MLCVIPFKTSNFCNNSIEDYENEIFYTKAVKELCENEELSPEKASDYIDALVNEAIAEVRKGNGKRTIELCENILKILDSGELPLDEDAFEIAKLKAYFNLCYGYFANRKTTTSDQMDLSMIEKAKKIYADFSNELLILFILF